MCVHADSLFTSMAESECAVCSSGIEVHYTISVKNCIFEKGVTAPGSPYISLDSRKAVRMEGNTFDAKTKMFETGVGASGYSGMLNKHMCLHFLLFQICLQCLND
jgi:hypothetical protein